MENIKKRIAAINWGRIEGDMNEKGFAVATNFLTSKDCDDLINDYNNPGIYRKTVTMERYRFGMGEYKYFDYPLPGIIQTMREYIYPQLVPVANNWMKMLGIEKQFPHILKELLTLCYNKQQTKPTALILKYGQGGHNTLHQDLYGEIYFPMQAVLFLNEPEKDYTGGEFVLLQQTPRAQSKAIVLQPKKGDILIFTTQIRPVKGSKGYYRVNLKHGVSELHSGERYTAGIIFHDALS